MLESIRRVDSYYYTIFALIVTAVSAVFFLGFASSFVIQLVLVPLVAGIADFVVKKIKSGKTKFPKDAIITGLILAMVMSPSPVYVQIIVSLVAILHKHIIKIENRKLFNPAAFGLLFAWIVFNSPPAWWAFVTPAVFLFLFSDYLIGRLPLAVTFYLLSVALISVSSFVTSSELSLNLISYPLLFFASVMVVEPKTSAITTKGMVLEGILLAATIFAVQQFTSIDMFIPMLLLMNLFVHFRIIK
ncbi:MAG: RnfABCDGE type electron transport complex subunit D [Candidatus Aenigmarchaeota archaeon]|nr:RnfABCDGE type electron transport complex subunit D [Candidatus Aenigmarchaeota archaeon]